VTAIGARAVMPAFGGRPALHAGEVPARAVDEVVPYDVQLVRVVLVTAATD
jgi:hypothetical protein